MGGFIRMVGMLPAGQARRRRHASTGFTGGFFGKLIADARAAEYEHDHATTTEDRLFYRKAWWKKVIIMAGGPMMNVFLAVVLLGIVFMGFGVERADPHRRPGVGLRDPGQRRRPPPATPTDPIAPAQRGRLPARATRSCRSTAQPVDRLGPVHRRSSAANGNGASTSWSMRDGQERHADDAHHGLAAARPATNPDAVRQGRLPRRHARPRSATGRTSATSSRRWATTRSTPARRSLHMPQRMYGVCEGGRSGSRTATRTAR